MGSSKLRHSPRKGSGFSASFDETIDFIIGAPPANINESGLKLKYEYPDTDSIGFWNPNKSKWYLT